MKVLVACEFSGTVRDAFISRGHDAWSCDLLPTESDPEFHIEGDVLRILDQGWDLMVAHPPCTYLANSGIRWLFRDKERKVMNLRRWNDIVLAAKFFKALLDAPIPRIAVENPIIHCYALGLIGISASQVIQPYWFGHDERKLTNLWLKNLPPLKPTDIVYGRESKILAMSPGADRQKERSRMFKGIANAMAEQWS